MYIFNEICLKKFLFIRRNNIIDILIEILG